jgi:uncharacterized protein YjiS (DUF1127 family)
MFNRLKSAVLRSSERAEYRRSYRALLDLEDHYLRDIGLTRDDIRGAIIGKRVA